MACHSRALITLSCVAALAEAVVVGNKVPQVNLHRGFPPKLVPLQDLTQGKKVVLVGLPAAFTPTWSNKQIPGYLAKQAELKAQGVDDVIVYSVNDGAVMEAWEKDQGTAGSLINLYGDPDSSLTKALDLVLDDPGAMAVLGNPRCKRFSMLIEDGVIKTLNVAGDGNPDEVSFAEKMLEDLRTKQD